METVYDHHPTARELKYLGRKLPRAYVPEPHVDQDGHFARIAWLYHFRRNRKKQDEYINKIADSDFQWETKYSINHFSSDADDLP